MERLLKVIKKLDDYANKVDMDYSFSLTFDVCYDQSVNYVIKVDDIYVYDGNLSHGLEEEQDILDKSIYKLIKHSKELEEKSLKIRKEFYKEYNL